MPVEDKPIAKLIERLDRKVELMISLQLGWMFASFIILLYIANRAHS